MTPEMASEMTPVTLVTPPRRYPSHRCLPHPLPATRVGEGTPA